MWDRWLEWHVETFPDFWVADMRGAAPRTATYYARLPHRDSWRDLSRATFLEELFVGDPTAPDGIVLHADTSTWRDRRSGNVQVRSALVAPEHADSLLAALQSMEARDCLLPATGDHYDWEGPIDTGGLRLVGLSRRHDQELVALDDDDTLARVSPSYRMPDEQVMEWLGLHPTNNGLVWVDDSGQVVVEARLWSDDVDGTKREYSAGSSGDRTTIRWTRLLSYLAHIRMNLVVNVTLERNLRGHGSGEHDYDKGTHRVFHIDANGTITDLDPGELPGSTTGE